MDGLGGVGARAQVTLCGSIPVHGPVTDGLLAGLINKTTAGKSGETLTLPVAVAIGRADGTKSLCQ